MNRLTSISIPEPCHQQWHQMAPVNDGRHCESCSKTVVDFTAMADAEIINYISRNNGTCGRFRQAQLGSVGKQFNLPASEIRHGWRKWVIVALIFSYTNIYEAKAQVRQTATPIHQTPSKGSNSEKTSGTKPGIKRSLKFKTITGVVKDENNKPILSATVAIPGTEYWSQTDSCGNFKLTIPAPVKKVAVSLGDYHDKIISLNDDLLNYEVELKYEGRYFAGPPKIDNPLKVAMPPLKFDFRPVFRKLFD